MVDFAVRRTVVRVALVFCCDGQIPLVDGQRAGDVGHVVVALCGVAARGDGVGANVLSRSTTDCVADDTRRIAVHQARYRSGQCRVCIAVCLALVCRSDRGRGPVHRDGARRRGHGTVARICHRHGVVVCARSIRGALNMSVADVVAHPTWQPGSATHGAIRTGDHVDVNRLTVGDGSVGADHAATTWCAIIQCHRYLRPHREGVAAGGLHEVGNILVFHPSGEDVFARLCVIGGDIGRVGGASGTGYHIGNAIIGMLPLVGIRNRAVWSSGLCNLGQCRSAAVADGGTIGGDGSGIKRAEDMLDVAGVARPVSKIVGIPSGTRCRIRYGFGGGISPNIVSISGDVLSSINNSRSATIKTIGF